MRASAKADSRVFPDLPVAPLAVLMVGMVERERRALTIGMPFVSDRRTDSRGRRQRTPDDARRRVCDQAKVPNRRLWAWEHGETKMVQFDIADAVLQRLDVLWWEVWRPCEGDAWHFVMVDAQGWCPACEAFCLAERAFAPELGF